MGSRPARGRGRPAAPSWTSYCDSIGDRSGLFLAVARAWAPTRALYPGSYLDLSPSVAIASVVYVDTDRRAARFFADQALVAAELEGRAQDGAGTDVQFLHADYTGALPLTDGSFDLLISLYAGPVWDHCRRYLEPGGLLLANASHGDAGLAALDPSLHLVAAVQHRDGVYRLDTSNLESYLVPKKPANADADLIRRQGRGIAYTKPAFAYVFRSAKGTPAGEAEPTEDHGCRARAGDAGLEQVESDEDGQEQPPRRHQHGQQDADQGHGAGQGQHRTIEVHR